MGGALLPEVEPNDWLLFRRDHVIPVTISAGAFDEHLEEFA